MSASIRNLIKEQACPKKKLPLVNRRQLSFGEYTIAILGITFEPLRFSDKSGSTPPHGRNPTFGKLGSNKV